MSIKFILCVYAGESFEAVAIETACHLAIQNHAELRILRISPPIVTYPDIYGVDAAMLEKEGIERTIAAEKSARDIARTTGLPFSHESDEDSDRTLPRAIFMAMTGHPDDIIPAAGRACDLVVIGRNDTDASDDIDSILAALLEVGAPVLVVPHHAQAIIKFADADQTVALAWDGSISAGRALRGLEFILKNGQKVQMICIRPKKSRSPTCPPADAVRWLTLHGFGAQIVQSGPFAMSDGEAILLNTRQVNADLLVMGAYGRGHLREMLAGGVTDHVLKQAGLPLLLFH